MTESTILKGASRVADEEKHLQTNDIGDLLVAEGLPPYAEMTRRGNGWQVIATSAVAGLVVRPSTTAMITLWNGEGTSGKSYIIDRVFTHCLVSVAAAGRFMIWGCIHPAGMANPTSELAASATNITGMSGKLYSGSAVVNLALGCVDNGWFPLSSSVDYEPSGVLPGAGIVQNIEGRLIIPPQAAISLQVVTSANTATFCTGLSWYEEVLGIVT